MSVRALNWAFDQRGLPDGPFVLLLVLGDLADEDGVVRGQSLQRLAARVGKGIDTVIRRLDYLHHALEDDGAVKEVRWLRIDSVEGGENIYRLHLPPRHAPPLIRRNATSLAQKGVAKMRVGGCRKNASRGVSQKCDPLGEKGGRKNATGGVAELRGEGSQKCDTPYIDSSSTLDVGVKELTSTTTADAPARGRSPADIVADRIASPFLDPVKSPRLGETAVEVARWLTAGADLEHDVIPTVTRLMARKRQPVTTWGYFTAAVREAAARRLAPVEPIQPLLPASGGLHDQSDAASRSAFASAPLTAAERDAAAAALRRSSLGVVAVELALGRAGDGAEPERDYVGSGGAD